MEHAVAAACLNKNYSSQQKNISVLTSYKSIGAADLSKVVEAGDGEGDVWNFGGLVADSTTEDSAGSKEGDRRVGAVGLDGDMASPSASPAFGYGH